MKSVILRELVGVFEQLFSMEKKHTHPSDLPRETDFLVSFSYRLLAYNQLCFSYISKYILIVESSEM